VSGLILPRRIREGRSLAGPRNQRGFIINPYALGTGGGGGSSLYTEIMADSPIHYWRNAEASGAVMVDEITTDGAYQGAVSLGNTAIYTGGPTCASNFSTTGPRGGYSTVTPGAINAMTLVSVVQFNSTSGVQPVGPNRDQGSTRMYQFRSNGTSLEFIKIVGSVESVSQAGVFTAGVTAIVAITVDSSGNYVMYKNGASIKTGSIAAANYGGSGDNWEIGYCTSMAAAMNGYTCENAVFNTALSGARMAAYATAAGL